MLWHNKALMIRQAAGQLLPPEENFRWRGQEITRLEGFTDAVFAFAVTLLVVSLEVPKTFTELVAAMKGFVAFAMCFAILVQVWYHHYWFSRRYGLQTRYIVRLNSLLLFVVLFYVYPLKFLFTLAVGGLTGITVPAEELRGMIHDSQVPALIIVYSIGYTAVFVIFALMYRYAYRNRMALELNEYEVLRTRHAMINHVGFASVGILVAIAALLLPLRLAGLSGFLFCLNGVYGVIVGSIFRKRQKLALERAQREAAAAAQS
jgi:uncharacterized membrane protein